MTRTTNRFGNELNEMWDPLEHCDDGNGLPMSSKFGMLTNAVLWHFCKVSCGLDYRMRALQKYLGFSGARGKGAGLAAIKKLYVDIPLGMPKSDIDALVIWLFPTPQAMVFGRPLTQFLMPRFFLYTSNAPLCCQNF